MSSPPTERDLPNVSRGRAILWTLAVALALGEAVSLLARAVISSW